MTVELWLGLVTGVCFGALLQQGRVARFEKQVGALLFRDMTILKFMLSAIIVGMVGINLLAAFGAVALAPKSTVVGANLVGGILFGAGWAITGYCPGTALAAVGEGRLHAVWAILGMVAGAALYAELYPALKTNVLAWGAFGEITLPGLLGVPAWVVVPVLSAVFLGLLVVFEKKKI